MRKSTLAALAASGLVLAAPSAASAAPTLVNIAPNGCVPTNTVTAGQDIAIQVAGFAPTDAVSAQIAGVAGGLSGLTDAAGNGSITGGFSNATIADERAFTPANLVVSGGASTAAAFPPVTIPVIVINSTVATTGGTRTGSPRRSVTWSFAGFAQPGKAVYGHVRFKGKTLRNFRFGTAGVCGTLTKKAPALPTRAGTIRAGSYTIQFDSSKTYKRSSTAPKYKYSVFTTFRSR